MATFHQTLLANSVGRDLVVGDLHGCLDLLQARLDELKFDPTRDRVFSVGDLVDRGPDSLGCLRLLREPWFLAVVGNHEDMLLSHFRLRDSAYHGPTDLFRNGGRWVHTLTDSERAELEDDLLPRVLAMPYVITVGKDDNKFHVAHAELMTGNVQCDDYWELIDGLPIDASAPEVLSDESMCEERLATMARSLTWGRRLILQVKLDQSTAVQTPAGPLLMSQQRWQPGLSLTFVGHTRVSQVVMHRSHMFIDGGAYGRRQNTRLRMIDTAEALQWVREH